VFVELMPLLAGRTVLITVAKVDDPASRDFTSTLISGVVRDHHHLPVWTLAAVPHVLEKGPEADGLESVPPYGAKRRTRWPLIRA
jgi:hypothetical protein